MLIDGNDRRGIDVGLLSKFPIGDLRSHIFDRDDRGTIFSRDCLEAQIRLPNGQPLTILCNHLKSKGYGSQADNDAKRTRQTTRIAQILDRYDLTRDYVIVAGDLNDTPDSAPLRPIIDLPGMHDVLALKFGADENHRWTYKYRSQKTQIDYLIVSEPLKQAMTDAGVERRGIYGIERITGETPRHRHHPSRAASDHGAVWADFSI